MDTTRSLRIGYITTRPVPSRETDTQQVLSTVDALGGAGVDVELIVPASYRRIRGRARLEAEVRDFYDVRRPFRLVPLWTLEPSPIQAERPAHALAAVLRARGRRYDLVHTRSRAAVTLCVALGIPVVFETYRRLGHDAPRLAALLARLARSRHLLGVVTHSHASADSLAAAGFPRDKLAVIHNGHDPRKLEPRLDRAAARAALGLPDAAPIALYTGNVQPEKGLDVVLEMAARTPEVRYLIVGGKDKDLAALTDDITRRLLTNVDCPGWRPAAELAPYFHAADALLIPPAAGPLLDHGRTVLPMKVFGYLAAGRPILAGDLPDVAEILRHGDNAWLVPPDDPAAAAAGLRRVLGDPELASRLGASALATSEDLTWDARAGHLITRYRAWLARA